MELNEVLLEVKNTLASFLGKRTTKDAAYAQIKNVINNGNVALDDEFRYLIARIAGEVIREYFTEKKLIEILESPAFKNYLNNYVIKYHLDNSFLKNYLTVELDWVKLMSDINTALSRVIMGINLYNYGDKMINSDNAADALEGVIGIVETLSIKIPVLGSYIGIQSCLAKKCLQIGADITKKYYVDLTWKCDIALYLAEENNIQKYADFNAFINERYRKEFGGSNVSCLYLDGKEFEEKLMEVSGVDDLTPTEIFYLITVTDVFGEYYLKNISNHDKVVSAMDEYCLEMLKCKEIKNVFRGFQEEMISELVLFLKDNDNTGEIGNNPDIGKGGSSETDPNKEGSSSLGNGSAQGGNSGSENGSCQGGSSGSGNGSNQGENSGSENGSDQGSKTGIKTMGDSSRFWGAYNGDFEDSQKATLPVDPIIFDLNHDGIFSSSIENGVFFDYEGDGFAEKTAWMSEGDGMLVRDINGNGIIDDGSELFGDRTLLSNGKLASSGFEALSDLDSNKDGIINELDETYSELKVWIDKNRDGISQNDELFSLKELGIKEIILSDENVTKVDENNNLITGMAYAFMDNGDIINVGELNFKTSTISSMLKEDIEVSEEVLRLPDIEGVGRVYSLRQSMMLNPKLKNLVSDFINTTDRFAKKGMVDEILLEWTNSGGVQEGSRGQNIDAGHLSVLEAFYGAKFRGIGGENPNSKAAIILNRLYEDLKYYVYANLIFKTECMRYLGITDVEYDINGQNSDINFALLKYMVKYDEKYDIEAAKDNIEVLAYCLNDTRIYNGDMGVEDLISIFKTDSVYFDCICKGITKGSYFTSSEKTDIYGDNENNYLKGTEENNILSGGDGDDILFTANGSSCLSGGAGNDIYIFTKNAGRDIINDNVGNNILFFEDITVDELKISTTGSYDITISIDDCDKYIVLKNFRLNSSYRNYTLEFSDGTQIKADAADSPIRNIVGSAGDDMITANYYNGMKAYGEDGNDRISGSSGNDELHGGAGDDVIYGEAGDDTIYGDAGNDKLYGEDGDDIYVFGRNSGTDHVNDTSGTSTLRFEEGITAEDIMVSVTGTYDITISLREGDTKVVLDNFGLNDSYKNYILEFSDGTRIKADAEDSPLRKIVGSAGDDTIKAYHYKGMKAYGEAGNDRISGSSGNDELHGGAGDDVIYGEAGDDTIYGDAGNDKLYGEDGDDIYVFGRNSGTDHVNDTSGTSTLRFEEGITAEDIMVSVTGTYDITISLRDGDTKVVLDSFRLNDSYKNFGIKFNDGSIWKINGNTYLLELQSGVDTMLNNEYTVSLNESSFDITDFGGNDIVNLGENMLNIMFERDGNNLDIKTALNENVLTINDWYTSENYQIETIVSGDGYEITNKQVQLLIDEMAAFTSENGISSAQAYKDNNAIEGIINQMWVRK